MGFIVNLYKKNFFQRYDKDPAIPFFSCADFPGLTCEQDVFRNTADLKIRFYLYSYPGYEPDKLILFCHGLGPGHTPYLAEIETLCRAGYRVLTLDYTGCGASGGAKLSSCNTPTKDAMELLVRLKPREEIIPVGHSLGGYTALNLANLLPTVHRAVILSGFISIADEMMGFVKLRFLANRVKRYEQKLDPHYGGLDNRAYLATTRDRLLWIHSTDDPVVGYKDNAAQAARICSPTVRVLTVEHKKHMPQYTAEALKKMNAWLGEYDRLVREKKLPTLEERRAFFADKPIGQMTEQDPAVFEEILGLLRG